MNEEARIRLMQTQVLSLETENTKMQAFEEARRQRIWLGHVAYVLEEIVCNYVFHGQYDISIGNIIWMDRCEDLTNEQSGHWFDFERFLNAKGFDIHSIVELSKELCVGGRLVDTHGQEAELRKKITQQNLEEWTHHLHPYEIEGAKSLIRLVAEFAADGRVLDNAGNAVSVVKAFLEKLDEHKPTFWRAQRGLSYRV